MAIRKITLSHEEYVILNDQFRGMVPQLFSLPWLMGDGKTTFMNDFCIANQELRIIVFTKTNELGDEFYNRVVEMGYPMNKIYHAVGKFYEDFREGNILVQGHLCQYKDEIRECAECKKTNEYDDCPYIQQSNYIEKATLVIAPVNMWYLGMKYDDWDVGFFDENFYDVLMNNWYYTEEEWKEKGVEWKDFPTKELRVCATDCIFNKTEKCRSWRNTNGYCPHLGYQKTLTPKITRKPRNREELNLYNVLGWKSDNKPRICGVWDNYKGETCTISFNYLPPLKIDDIYFASATCSFQTVKNILFGRKQTKRHCEEILNPKGKRTYSQPVFCLTEIPKNKREKKSKQLTGTKKKVQELIVSGRIWKYLKFVNNSVDELDIPFDERTFAFGYEDVIALIDTDMYPLKKDNFAKSVGTNKHRKCTYVLGLNRFQFPFAYKFLIADLFHDLQIVNDLENEKRVQPMGRGRNSVIVLLYPSDHPQFPNVTTIDLPYFCRNFIVRELKQIKALGKEVTIQELYRKCPHSIRIGKQLFYKIAKEVIRMSRQVNSCRKSQ